MKIRLPRQRINYLPLMILLSAGLARPALAAEATLYRTAAAYEAETRFFETAPR